MNKEKNYLVYYRVHGELFCDWWRGRNLSEAMENAYADLWTLAEIPEIDEQKRLYDSEN